MVSALGFGLAYYFDTENGDLRRKRLQETVSRVVADIRSARTSEDDGLSPAFDPVLHGRPGEDRPRGGAGSVEALG